jgi:hypothetical protein
MLRISLRRLAVLVLAALVVWGLGGCWNPFAPDKGDGGGGTVDEDYRLRTTPENVLHNMCVAYEHKNADEYLACLAEGFTFHSDPDDVASGAAEEFYYKDDERTIHENMFSETGPENHPERAVDSIQLGFTLTSKTSDEVAPGDTIWTIEEDVDLRVNLFSGTTYLANAPSQYVLQEAPETGPNGEKLWEIIDWYDLVQDHGKRGQDPGAETVTVSELRAMYGE